MTQPARPDWLPYSDRYAAIGWATFPLHAVFDGLCTCGDVDCRSKGKHPRFEKGLIEKGVLDATTDATTRRAWAERWPQSNLGLALRDGLVAVDTDPRNGGDATLEALLAEHGKFPDTAMAMTGGGGTHHLFYNRDRRALPGKLGKGVDIKGEGGYIVVEPSVHELGASYAWEASCDPLEGQLIAELPAWIGTTAAKPAAIGGKATGIIPPRQLLELRSALVFLDNDDRDVWLAVGMALHSTGASNAFGIWAEWSQHSPKYDAADQRRVWASFKADGKRHVESIFAMAQEAGWVNPASGEAVQFSAEVQARLDAANARTRVEIVEAKPANETSPIPVRVLEDAATWIDQRYGLTHPEVTRHTVLALAALGASRIYVGEGGSPAHLCLGIVAESSILTAYARDAITRILDDAGLRRMMRLTRANGPTNVYATLWRSPAAIHVVGDYGYLAQFAKRQPSGVLDQAFAVMADAYAQSAIYVDSAAEAGLKANSSDDQLVVYAPALTTLLLSTHEQMAALLQRGEMNRGLLINQLPVVVDTAGAVERTPVAEATPQWLRDALRAVRRLPTDRAGDLSAQDIFGHQPFMKPNQLRVRFATDFVEHSEAINGISADLAHRPLVMAAQGTARRIATALGAWADPRSPEATRDILDWSTGYVIKLMRAWLERYDTLGNDEGKADVAQRLVELIASRKTAGVARSEVHMYCRPFRMIRDKEKRTRLLDGLIEDGDLVEFTPAGSRQKLLVAAKFARVSPTGLVK